MKRITKLVITSLMLVVVISGCSYLRPEPEVKIKTKTEKIKVAVINKDKVWTESKTAQQYQQQLKQKVATLEDKAGQQKTDGDEINQKQQLVQEMNQARENLRQEFKQEIQLTIEKIMNEEDYDIVLDKKQVKYGGTDITQQVIKKLDDKE